jgi:hypothetical protein
MNILSLSSIQIPIGVLLDIFNICEFKLISKKSVVCMIRQKNISIKQCKQRSIIYYLKTHKVVKIDHFLCLFDQSFHIQGIYVRKIDANCSK